MYHVWVVIQTPPSCVSAAMRRVHHSVKIQKHLVAQGILLSLSFWYLYILANVAFEKPLPR